MTVYIFSGPTLRATDKIKFPDFVFLPPVEQGHILALSKAKPSVIGIIDGRFHDVPSVWHKEILWALNEGIPVFGSASMGALRAAELNSFGMCGVGWVFDAYINGLLEDDDEVTIAHAHQDEDYVPVSEAMVNIRQTLAAAEAAGIISANAMGELLSIGKETYYPLRTYGGLLNAGKRNELLVNEMARLESWLAGNKVDQKRLDALEMLRLINEEDYVKNAASASGFVFQSTVFFQRAFRDAGALLME